MTSLVLNHDGSGTTHQFSITELQDLLEIVSPDILVAHVKSTPEKQTFQKVPSEVLEAFKLDKLPVIDCSSPSTIDATVDNFKAYAEAFVREGHDMADMSKAPFANEIGFDV